MFPEVESSVSNEPTPTAPEKPHKVKASKEKPKKTKPNKTKKEATPKKKQVGSGTFRLAVINDIKNETITLLPKLHSTRRETLEFLREGLAGESLSLHDTYAVIQVKEWDLRPKINKVTKIDLSNS